MHPSNVSVSAGLTGVYWCEQGCHLSSLDQKPTRTSAGTIRQGRPASARQMPVFLFPPRRVGDCGFDWDSAALSGVQKSSLDRPASCKEQKSSQSGRFCLFCQSQAQGHHPRKTHTPDQTFLSPVICTVHWTCQGRQRPPSSLIMSPTGTSTPTHHSGVFTGRTRKRFVSYRLRGEYEKPWLEDPKFKRTKYNNYVIYVFVFLGVCAAGVVAFFQIRPAISGPVSASRPLSQALILIEIPDMSRVRGRI